MAGFNGAALDATAVCAILIVLVWAGSRFSPPDLAERLRWALRDARKGEGRAV